MKSFILIIALLGASAAHESSTSPIRITCPYSYREQAKDLVRGLHRPRHRGNDDDKERSHEAGAVNQTTVHFDSLQEPVGEARSHGDNGDPVKVIAKRAWQWLHGQQDDRDNIHSQKFVSAEDGMDVVLKIVQPAAKETSGNNDSGNLGLLRRLRQYVFGASAEEHSSDDPLPQKPPRDVRNSEHQAMMDAQEKSGLTNKVQEWAQAQLRQWVGCECQCAL